MGAEAMKITVVGAVLIIAAVAAGVLLLLALKEHANEIGEPQSGDSQQNPPLQGETST
jgi:hypothetical protein